MFLFLPTNSYFLFVGMEISRISLIWERKQWSRDYKRDATPDPALNCDCWSDLIRKGRNQCKQQSCCKHGCAKTTMFAALDFEDRIILEDCCFCCMSSRFASIQCHHHYSYGEFNVILTLDVAKIFDTTYKPVAN